MGWSNTWPKPKLIIGVDQGSPDGDKTIVGIADVNMIGVIGESVELTIPIAGQWPRKVQAIQISDLAVHEQLPNSGMWPYKWQVTHVPTLTMFDRAIPDGDWTQEQLVKWCWKVQQETDIWQAICSYDNSNYKNIPKSFLEIIQAYCLSISPGEILKRKF